MRIREHESNFWRTEAHAPNLAGIIHGQVEILISFVPPCLRAAKHAPVCMWVWRHAGQDLLLDDAEIFARPWAN